MTTRTFRVPAYSGRVVLCMTQAAYKRVRKSLDTHCPDSEFRDLERTKGVHVRVFDEKKDESVYVCGWFDRNPSTLVHELAHMTFDVLTYSGVPISKRNDEAFAYLIDRLFSESARVTKGARKGWRKAKP